MEDSDNNDVEVLQNKGRYQQILNDFPLIIVDVNYHIYNKLNVCNNNDNNNNNFIITIAAVHKLNSILATYRDKFGNLSTDLEVLHWQLNS